MIALVAEIAFDWLWDIPAGPTAIAGNPSLELASLCRGMTRTSGKIDSVSVSQGAKTTSDELPSFLQHLGINDATTEPAIAICQPRRAKQ